MEEWRHHFLHAEPFPHVVIDGLFDPEPVEAVRDFPDSTQMVEKPGKAGASECRTAARFLNASSICRTSSSASASPPDSPRSAASTT